MGFGYMEAFYSFLLYGGHSTGKPLQHALIVPLKKYLNEKGMYS